MAEQVLSQNEVDALLAGVAKNPPSTDEPTTAQSEEPVSSTPVQLPRAPSVNATEPTPYDFTKGDSGLRGNLPGLEVIFNNFARRLKSMFASEVGKSVEVSFKGLEICPYEQWVPSFPLPASIHAVRLEPLRGIGVVVIEARLAFAMIELFFGGAGQKTTTVENRDFTSIESRFLGKFVERMLVGMEEAWQSTVVIRGRYLRSEINPYLLNPAGAGDAMILAPYHVNMDPIRGTILFSIPFAAVEELRDKLKNGVQLAEDPENARIFERLKEPFMDVELDVQAVVDVVNLSVGEIMRMRPGDIIQLNSSGLHEVRLVVEGVPKFIGKAAERNGNKVFVASRQLV